jgi:CheY-like chemotaxis protein
MKPHVPSGAPLRGTAAQSPQKPEPLRPRVLVVDDEPDLLELILRMLESQNYEVCGAADCAQAIRAVQRATEENAPFSLLLTDMHLTGGLSGLETLRCVRQTAPLLPAVVSSGDRDDPVMADCRAHGFSLALAKPYTIATLISTVEEALGIPPIQPGATASLASLVCGSTPGQLLPEGALMGAQRLGE